MPRSLEFLETLLDEPGTDALSLIFREDCQGSESDSLDRPFLRLYLPRAEGNVTRDLAIFFHNQGQDESPAPPARR